MKEISLNQLQRALYQHRSSNRWLRMGQLVASYALALLRDVFAGDLSLRAMSLVYTTLLSLVPILALSFSLLKAFGMNNALKGVLNEFLAPLGPQGAELSQNILGFVNNMKVGVLGSVGVILLVYTAISLIRKVEASFNFAWDIEHGRDISQVFSDYLSVLLVGPLLVFSALGLTASIKSGHVVGSLMQVEPFGTMLVFGFKLLPYALICGAFSFVYGFLPNVRVRWQPAVIAGICAGVAWQAASVVFATFVARSGKYNAIYSGFAIAIFLLIWVYVAWQVLLLGCRLAFYLQYPERLLPHPQPAYGSRKSELLALTAYGKICRAFLDQQSPPLPAQLARRLQVTESALARALAPLLVSGVLAKTTVNGGYLPARDLDQLSVAALWLLTRGDEIVPPGGESAAVFLARAEAAAGGDTLSVKQWLQAEADVLPKSS